MPLVAAALACMPSVVPEAVPYPAAPRLGDLPLALVERVVDGDSVELRMEDDGRRVRAQLHGVRAPLRGSTIGDEREAAGETAGAGGGGEAWGAEAAWVLRSMAEGEAVRVRWAGGPDRYGRRFAMLYREPDGLPLNIELIRMGLGDVPEEHAFDGKAEFVRYADRAAALGRGVWGDAPAWAPAAGVAASGAEDLSGSRDAADALAPDAAPEPAEPKDVGEPGAPGGTRIFISRSGSKYHREGCRYVTETSREVSLADARAKHEPCRVCNPPE